ncbi:LexA DNA binding domain-containing protein [Anaerosporobacter mobilis DSM 15930]|jgi:SOS-response transcriptional repressor LexA|uniref:LexA DNA binding domain-containing protein n=1 Tax=Anaerosporobacter mobilis DSM 15930 TaxID=1120996 RepID=A0A1M7NIX5_9FIRM|nr:hypothetical protein [Anaerosporobacter mobilis]SHN03217.1 LexA DNA binding domain-containing protein [Anaerosporobacter mobilis DSM 15930]
MKRINKVGEERRKQIRDFIVMYNQEHGYGPTFAEIGKGVYITSSSCIQNHINTMLENGMLETDAEIGASRALRVPGYAYVKVGEEGENTKSS